MRVDAVARYLDISKSQVYRMMDDEKINFPKPVSIGGRCKGWVTEEVSDWAAACVEERDRGAV